MGAVAVGEGDGATVSTEVGAWVHGTLGAVAVGAVDGATVDSEVGGPLGAVVVGDGG